MAEPTLTVHDLELVALTGERAPGPLPAVRSLSISFRLSLDEPEAGAAEGSAERLSATATLDVQVLDGAGVEGAESSDAAGDGAPADDAHAPAAAYAASTTVEISAEGGGTEDEMIASKLLDAAWPALRLHTIDHALRLGMGRLPLPVTAPEQLIAVRT